MVTETSTGIRTTQPVLGARESISSGIVMTHYSQTHNVGAEGPNRLLTLRKEEMEVDWPYAEETK